MLATDPPELTLLADRAPVPTPATFEWGGGIGTHGGRQLAAKG